MDEFEKTGSQPSRETRSGGRHSSTGNGKSGGGKPVKYLPYILAGVVALVIVAVLLFLLLGGGGGQKTGLEGLWTVDGVTSYRFERGGKGAMELPSANYAFKYTVQDGVLSIDFEDEAARDNSYTYSVSDTTLVLTGIKVNEYDEDYQITFSRVEEN